MSVFQKEFNFHLRIRTGILRSSPRGSWFPGPVTGPGNLTNLAIFTVTMADRHQIWQNASFLQARHGGPGEDSELAGQGDGAPQTLCLP